MGVGRQPSGVPGARDSNYRRGAIMGLTMAEAFILIAFALLLLFTFWRWEKDKENTPEVLSFKNLPEAAQRMALELAHAPESAQGQDVAEHWRFIREADLKRLQDAAEKLPAEIRMQLADLVESDRAEQILPELAALEEMLATAPQIVPGQDLSKYWRFISETDLQRLQDAAEKLPADIRMQLADLVESKRAKQILSELGALEEIIAAGQSLKGLSGRIGQMRAQEEELAAALRAEIGHTVAAFNGEISDTGVITFPEEVVFQKNSSDVSPALTRFLRQACEPWLRVLKDSSIPIEEVRIEGHASSEWRRASTADEAYLGNLGLSQRRSQSVLLTCLSHIGSDDIRSWARAHLVAVGHSSSRPVLDASGQEDPGKSRRVVFRATPDRKVLLDEIGTEVAAAASRLAYKRELFGEWSDTDGDCMNERHDLLRERSSDNIQLSKDRCRVAGGRWHDPYSGRSFQDPDDVEIDHLVPLSWAWHHGAETWPQERRRAFFADPSNLIITAAELNRQKGAAGPGEWLPPSQEFHCAYIESFMGVVEKYGLHLSDAEGELFGKQHEVSCQR